MIDVAIVCPCKNRLRYLQRCLPSWRTQNLGPYIGLSIVVVGYGCPQRSADWANGLGFQDVRGIAVERDTETFCLGRARNVGMRAAIDAGAHFMAVVDADLELPSDFIRRYVSKMIGDGLGLCKTGWTIPEHPGEVGFGSLVLVSSDTVLRLRGYDESFRTYGHDDTEFSLRAEAFGINAGWLPWDRIVHHCEDLTVDDRVEFYPVKNLEESASANLEIAKNTRRPVNLGSWGEV